MQPLRHLAMLCLLGVAMTPMAGAAVVNFDDYQPRYVYQSAVLTDGFRFSFSTTCTCVGVEDRPPENLDGTPLPGAYNGTASLLYGNDPLVITAIDGQAFYLDTLDLGLSWYVPDAEVGSVITVSYLLAAGGTGTVDAALDRSYSTLTVAQDVLSVTISGSRSTGYVSLDNVVVNNNVPEPASAALAALALTGAGLARRRRRG